MKFYQLLWKEEVPQTMGIIFLYVALVLTATVILGQFFMALNELKPKADALSDWTVILVPSISIPIAVGIIWSAILFFRRRPHLTSNGA